MVLISEDFNFLIQSSGGDVSRRMMSEIKIDNNLGLKVGI